MAVGGTPHFFQENTRKSKGHGPQKGESLFPVGLSKVGRLTEAKARLQFPHEPRGAGREGGVTGFGQGKLGRLGGGGLTGCLRGVPHTWGRTSTPGPGHRKSVFTA